MDKYWEQELKNMSIQEKLDLLQDLRERWKTATKSNRKVIEIRAKLLLMSLKPKTKKEIEVDEKVAIFM